MPFNQAVNKDGQFELLLKHASFSNASSRKKHVRYSGESTSEQDLEARNEMSLRLFQGIRQLEEPVSCLQMQAKEQSIDGLASLQSPFSLKDFRPSISYRQLFSMDDVKGLLERVVESCFGVMRSKMELQSKRIQALQKKIVSLSNVVSSLPLQVKRIQNYRRKIQFEGSFAYEREIKLLNFKLAELEKQVHSLKKKENQYSKLSPQNSFVSPHELCLPPVSEFAQEPQEKSLLQEIEEDLAHSQLKENSKQENHVSFPMAYSQKIVPQPYETTENTVKKRHKSTKVEPPSKSVWQTTNKKPKVIGDLDQRLMSFAKNNSEVVIEEEEVVEGRSDGVRKSGEQGEMGFGQQGRKKENKQTEFNPQRSLNFGSPSYYQNQPTNPSYDNNESEVEEFQMQDSAYKIQRLSLSKRKVPSLLEQSQSPQQLLLSREEKYLLEEIRELRKIVQWDGEVVVEEGLCESGAQRLGYVKKSNLSKRQAKGQYLIALGGLRRAEVREKQLLKLLNKTKNELNQLKTNLVMLVPCQYCEFRDQLKNVLT